MDHFERERLRELQGRIDALESRAAASREAERNALDQVHALRADVARLTLLVESLRRVAVEAGLTTADAFLERVRQVDAEDGIGDLQRIDEDPDAPALRLCACRHFNPPHLEKCQYCGRALAG